MKIWMDLTNSPHVPFFAGMINELRQTHEVLLTTRPLANTLELLEPYGFPYHVIGRHYGQNKIKKALGFVVRIWQLFIFLRKANIDVAVSQSSYYSPLVAKLIGAKGIYLNDNEHATGNRIAFIFADRIMIPEFLDIRKIQKQWAKPEKVIPYPGVKEGIYLWNYQPNSLKNFTVLNRENKKVIFIRPEPWAAHYYNGKRNFIDELLMELKETYKIVLLPRDKMQKRYYEQDRFAGVIVPEKPVRLDDIVGMGDLFIGAGGTMTREAAVLGIPTISIYQGELLQVDEYLMNNGLMVHNKNPDAAFVTHFLETVGRRPADRKLLDKGKQAYELMKHEVVTSGPVWAAPSKWELFRNRLRRLIRRYNEK